MYVFHSVYSAVCSANKIQQTEKQNFIIPQGIKQTQMTVLLQVCIIVRVFNPVLSRCSR